MAPLGDGIAPLDGHGAARNGGDAGGGDVDRGDVDRGDVGRAVGRAVVGGDSRDADEPSEHRTDGLDLARSIARAYADPSARRAAPAARRRRPPRRRNADPRSSGAHPDDRDPQLLDTTIARVVAEHGWQQDLTVHAMFARWPGIVGPEVAQHCTPVRFTDGELVVQADSTAWATQMRLLAATVVGRLNQRLGHGTVLRIRTLGPQAPSWTRGPRRVKGRGPRDTYG